MAKAPRASANGTGQSEADSSHVAPAEATEAEVENAKPTGDLLATAATVGVIGVGVALFEAALIPGMIIGVAAMLAPKALPAMSATVEPAFRYAVRGVVRLGHKAKHAVAEAQEQVRDIVVEADNSAPSSKAQGRALDRA